MILVYAAEADAEFEETAVCRKNQTLSLIKGKRLWMRFAK